MRTISCLLTALLLLAPAAQAFGAGQKPDKQAQSMEQIRSQVAKLGVGEKARATIKLKDGTKTKGYVYRAGDDDFVMRDRKTDNPTTIRYADVAKVEADHGHSSGGHVLTGVAIGVGAVVTAILVVFFLDQARR
ncbi:MAG TPA: hypothetical protein VLQ90_11225 [Pyrinomonadaceae bacterium]|nr:hypothetical protein [Pyrinomonadaceae bacterium]